MFVLKLSGKQNLFKKFDSCVCEYNVNKKLALSTKFMAY